MSLEELEQLKIKIIRVSGVINRLNNKIKELEEELIWDIPHRRVFEPSAFLFYLKQIRGDKPMMPRQECPNEI